MEEKRYCVVATSRISGDTKDGRTNRLVISDVFSSKETAQGWSKLVQGQSRYTNIYKYFKVAKYPFKERQS